MRVRVCQTSQHHRALLPPRFCHCLSKTPGGESHLEVVDPQVGPAGHGGELSWCCNYQNLANTEHLKMTKTRWLWFWFAYFFIGKKKISINTLKHLSRLNEVEEGVKRATWVSICTGCHWKGILYSPVFSRIGLGACSAWYWLHLRSVEEIKNGDGTFCSAEGGPKSPFTESQSLSPFVIPWMKFRSPWPSVVPAVKLGKRSKL